MKKLLCMLTLVLAGSAHAQVYFEPGSARPINPGAATVHVERQHQVRPRVRLQRVVRCRNGRHGYRQCKHHRAHH